MLHFQFVFEIYAICRQTTFHNLVLFHVVLFLFVKPFNKGLQFLKQKVVASLVAVVLFLIEGSQKGLQLLRIHNVADYESYFLAV